MIPVAPMELTHGVVKYGLQRKGDRVLTGGLIEFFPPGQSVFIFLPFTQLYMYIYVVEAWLLFIRKYDFVLHV